MNTTKLSEYERANGRRLIKAVTNLLSLNRLNGTKQIIRHSYSDEWGGLLPAGKHLVITFSLEDGSRGILIDDHPVEMEIVD